MASAAFYETTIGRAAGRLPLQSILFYDGRNQVFELDVPALAVYEANELNGFFDRALNAQKFVDSIVRIER